MGYSDHGFQDEPPHGGGGGEGGGIAALLQLGGALYEGHQNRKVAKRNTDLTLEANKRESELAYQREMEMMRYQNFYNSPEQQMQRYIAAGLNPHLIYGQGTPGNMDTIPRYHPAEQQYKYESAHAGAAISGVLPTLMAVGTWMQNMRATEAEIRSKQVQQERGLTETERARQLIEFLKSRNPQLLQDAEQKLSLYPYQKQMMDYQSNISREKLFELEQEFRYKYGESLFAQYDPSFEPKKGEGWSDFGGTKRLQFLQEASKTKLAEAKASWADFDITDPQALMMMVLQGVMGMAGAQLRLSTHAKNRGKITHETESRMRGGRTTIRRRIYDK